MPVDLGWNSEPADLQFHRDALTRVRVTTLRPWIVSRYPHHRARRVPPTTVELVACPPPPTSSPRAPTTNCAWKGATRARSPSAVFGGARPCCCSARRQPCVTRWRGEGRAEWSGWHEPAWRVAALGHAIVVRCTRSSQMPNRLRLFPRDACLSRDRHACCDFSWEGGGQGESGRPLEPLSLLALFPSSRQGALTWLGVTVPWTTVSVSRRCVWHKAASLWDWWTLYFSEVLWSWRWLYIDWLLSSWIGDLDCWCWPVFSSTVSDFTIRAWFWKYV